MGTVFGLKPALVATLSLITLMVSTLSLAHAFVFLSVTNNGVVSRCLLANPTNIQYNLETTNAQDSIAANIAAEEWNDVPAMIHFVQTTNVNPPPTIFVKSVPGNPSNEFSSGGVAIAFTLGNSNFQTTCHNGYADLPWEIDINDDQIAPYAQSHGLNDLDLRTSIIAHEMGHTMGLQHTQVPCALMEEIQGRFTCGNGIFSPQIDDIKGVASLYGWTRDTAFANTASSGSTSINTNPGYTTPLEMTVDYPNPGTYVSLYNLTSLPSSNVAVMMAYVTPKILYRFAMGWQQGANTPPSSAFANLELDDDGAKFVSAGNAGNTVQSVPTPGVTADHLSYFLEIVIIHDPASNIVRAQAYDYQICQAACPAGSIESGNGTETFGGAWSGQVTLCSLGVCTGNYWGDVKSFSVGVWTDKNSNFPSDYEVDHFWNYQGNKPLVPPPDFAGTVVQNPVCLQPNTPTVPDSMFIEGYSGFSGTVNLAASVVPTLTGGVVASAPASLQVYSGQDTNSWVYVSSGSNQQNYVVTVTMTNSAYELSHNMTLTVNVSSSCSSGGGGGGGGSVASGTLITLANGTKIPVQNLQVGALLLSYDMNSQQYVNVTITSFTSVATHNQMVIQAGQGKPLIVDQNPAQKVYTMFPNGTWTLVSVTALQIGYSLFDASTLTWVSITGIRYENSGTHVMYDLYTTAPFCYIADNYLDPLKQ
jgi:Matrixin